MRKSLFFLAACFAMAIAMSPATAGTFDHDPGYAAENSITFGECAVCVPVVSDVAAPMLTENARAIDIMPENRPGSTQERMYQHAVASRYSNYIGDTLIRPDKG